MSDPKNLEELYIEEMQDLWSANDQMARTVGKLADALGDKELSDRFRKSVEGIEKHTGVLRSLIEGAGGELKKEHCRGMEGLVAEAKKHVVESDSPADVKAVAAIAQFQRMCHYGLAGFGTAKAFAEALGRSDDASKLDKIVDDIYGSDEYMSEIAERSKNMEARDG
jgi:ferritin-like metal-binding protein YciE